MFLSAVDVRFHDNGEIGGTLLSPLGYQWRDMEIWVPGGFVSDFGSVPGLFSGFVPRIGLSAGAFVLHDYVYRQCGLINEDTLDTHIISRKDADDIMRAAMRDLHVPAWRRYLAWAGCRIGAGLSWDKRCKGLGHYQRDEDRF